jgi:hypothetical protein
MSKQEEHYHHFQNDFPEVCRVNWLIADDYQMPNTKEKNIASSGQNVHYTNDPWERLFNDIIVTRIRPKLQNILF